MRRKSVCCHPGAFPDATFQGSDTKETREICQWHLHPHLLRAALVLALSEQCVPTPVEPSDTQWLAQVSYSSEGDKVIHLPLVHVWI